uniref:Uncharacterized protein n=1 Tax=Anguilla anguilla TaxID=7936 RepID=A0A0E9S1C5_ANGAN
MRFNDTPMVTFTIYSLCCPKVIFYQKKNRLCIQHALKAYL